MRFLIGIAILDFTAGSWIAWNASATGDPVGMFAAGYLIRAGIHALCMAAGQKAPAA